MKNSCPLPKNWEEYVMTPDKVVGPFTTQHLLFVIALACAVLTSFTSHFNIMKHLHRYTEPKQQRQIIRIIYTPVVFAVLSAVSIINYKIAVYFEPIIDLYETFALAALWLLYVEYVTPDEHSRMAYFATLEHRIPKGTFKPKGYTVVPGGSQRWYQSKHLAVFLFVVVDILLTAVQEITQAFGQFCPASFSPRFAHIWVLIIQSITLGWAINAIVRYYIRMKNEPDFAVHKPGLKIISFKLIVGVNFFQDLIFDILISTEAIKGSHKVTGYDLKYGIPAALVAFEQILFAIFFHYAFQSREYHESMKQDMVTPRMGIFRAAAHAFNPMDMLKGMFSVFALLGSGILPFDPKNRKGLLNRGRTMGYGNDSTAHLEPLSNQHSEMKDGPYTNLPAGVTVTAPQQETGFSNNYGYNGPTYPQQASYAEAPRGRQSPPGYEAYGDETERLHPGGYARTHSRDSSIEGRDARSAKQIV